MPSENVTARARSNAPSSSPATLADGSTVALAVHEAKVSWHTKEHPVDVLASEGGSSIGVLHGSRLTMDVVPGGAVRIEERT